MPPRIIIRDATPADHAALRALTAEAYGEFAAALAPEHWARMKASVTDIDALAATGEIIAAEADGAIAGTATYCAPGRWDAGLVPVEWAAVRMVGVSPSHRGLGLGRLLTEECVTRARREGVATIGLHTSELMAHARAIYEALGFRIERELPERLGVRYWLYRLDL